MKAQYVIVQAPTAPDLQVTVNQCLADGYRRPEAAVPWSLADGSRFFQMLERANPES